MSGFNYLPLLTENAIENMISGNPSEVKTELASQTFERIGLDRLYYILSDIGRNYGAISGFHFLDIGCNTGLIANLLGAYGNSVVGIDNAVINCQKKYSDLTFEQLHMAELIETDIDDYLSLMKQKNMSFDFILLLSVAHQWEFGYAKSGGGKKEADWIHYVMDSLLSCTRKAIYYECPVQEPGFPDNYGTDFLARFLSDYAKISIVKIEDTIASNGYMRALYRITRAKPFAVFDGRVSCRSKGKGFDWSCFLKKYQLSGKILQNGISGAGSPALIGESFLTILLEKKPRDAAHPMGVQKDSTSCYDLWKRIQHAAPSHVMPISRIFEEGAAQIPILSGIPGQDTVMIPAWQRTRLKGKLLYHRKELPIIQSWLYDLSDGLSGLHSLRIAHGDPYPFNVILEEQHATWIDLGNVSDDPGQIQADIIIFTAITCQYYLQQSCTFSSLLLERLRCLVPGKPYDICGQLANVFSEKYQDIRPKNSGDDLMIAESIHQFLEALYSRQEWTKYRGMPLKCLYHYYTEFCIWQKQAFFWKEIAQFDRYSNDFSQQENLRQRVSSDQVHIQEKKVSDLGEVLNRLQTERQQQLVQMDRQKEENQRLRHLHEEIKQRCDSLRQQTLSQETELSVERKRNEVLTEETEHLQKKQMQLQLQYEQASLEARDIKNRYQLLIEAQEQKKLKNRIKRLVYLILRK